MAYEWTEWVKRDDLDPYIDWSLNGPGEDRIVADPLIAKDGEFFVQRAEIQFLPQAEPWPIFNGLDQIVIPALARNQKLGTGPIKAMRPNCNEIPDGDTGPYSTEIHEDTIIAGVIDVGMPLGHRRLRFADGKTRVLAAWQMIGNWDLKSQQEIPFGCEFYEDELNQKLEAHSNGLLGRLDEDAFHKNIGILNLNQVTRQTMVAHRVSHGAHVLDMVAGADPTSEADFARKIRIIAVNAPSSSVFGASGTYLDSYMLHAIQRIADIADGIWKNKFGAGPHVGRIGFPIVINLSFGRQAGSKDTLDRFAAALEHFKQLRRDKNKSPIYFVMPTGNDNLTRCNAFLEPHETETLSLDWRMQPQDQSSNFSEVWTGDPKQSDKWAKTPVQVSPLAPGSTVAPLPPPGMETGHSMVTKLKRGGIVVAHLYLSRVDEKVEVVIMDKAHADDERCAAEKYDVKFRYILCVAPTFRLDASPSVAASGVWTISAENVIDEPIQSVLSVQTDQGLTPNRTINRRSYFDDIGYRNYGHDGRVLESYSYPRNAAGKFENLDILADTPVRRHGTMNASAAHDAVARVGGYRASDGRPAYYSSTGRGRTCGEDDGTEIPSSGGNGQARAPTAAFPTDDGPAHGGILSAGAVDGSRVVMRGTSFASSQAARLMLKEVLAAREGVSENQTIFQIATAAEQVVTQNGPAILVYDRELIDVIGGGRIPAPQQRQPRRLGDGPFDG